MCLKAKNEREESKPISFLERVPIDAKVLGKHEGDGYKVSTLDIPFPV